MNVHYQSQTNIILHGTTMGREYKQTHERTKTTKEDSQANGKKRQENYLQCMTWQ